VASPAVRQRLTVVTLGLVGQFLSIAAGVYLGMQADAWKEERAHREAERAALANFRTELAANHDRLLSYAPIYKAYADSMRISQQRGDAMPRTIREVFRRLGWRGLNPVAFQHTAWDLALATQALSYVPPPLAFRVARIYSAQEHMENLQRDVSAALFNPTALDDARVYSFLLTFSAYLEDSIIQSQLIGKLYAQTLPAIDSAVKALPR